MIIILGGLYVVFLFHIIQRNEDKQIKNGDKFEKNYDY